MSRPIPSARRRVKALADARAMEEQMERENPIHGAGATPSMGLSQFRGGRKSLAKKIAAAEAATPSLYIEEMDQEAEMPSGEYDGAGAHAQGKHLAEHIHKLRGGAFLKDFARGLHSVGSGYDTGKYEGEGKMRGGGPIIGSGKLVISHGGEEEECSESDKEEMVGKGRRRARPKRMVSATDGRRKRAEIVRKVMTEKGLSMIEASKYVKANGLY